MNVYHKIVRIKPANPAKPTAEISTYVKTHPGLGIDFLILPGGEGLGEITLDLICSDANPSQPRTMADIDKLLMHFEVTKELSTHRSDPVDSGHTNHRLQISVDKDSEQKGKIQGDSKEVERA